MKVSVSGEMTAVSLCSGAGGLDLGLEASGWNVIAQVECDQDCVSTLRHSAKMQNRPRLLIESQIEDIDPGNLRRRLQLKKGELGLLAGGPPCQPFTTHGLRQAINDDRASTVFPKYLRYVREFLPRSAVIENVDGLLSAALQHRPLNLRGSGNPPLTEPEMKGSFLKWLIEEFSSLGYACSWGVLDAADYGVPQFRQRAFIIATRDGDPCYLPVPTYGQTGQPRYRTVRDALRKVKDPGPIQPLSAVKTEVYKLIPAGGNWRDLSRAAQERTMGAAFRATGGKSGWWRRLSWDSPSPTILGMPDHSSTGLIHPDHVRCLGLNECAVLQTFPSWVTFSGRPRSQYQQVGNAVPPLLASIIGSKIAQHLAGIREAEPVAPAWRRLSANRRIGTHGWSTPTKSGPRFTIVVKIREDHVWRASRSYSSERPAA
jgi:DNA (cytosine-5)-methyltransferase 1